MMSQLTEENLYESVVLSLHREIELFRLEHMPSSQYLNWDEHAEMTELPEGDLIGLAGVGLAEDTDKEYDIPFAVLVSTYKDPGMHRMTKLLSRLRARFVAGTKLPVFTEVGGVAVEKTWMVTRLPLAVTPASKAEVRLVQGIEARALLDPGAASSLR